MKQRAVAVMSGGAAARLRHCRTIEFVISTLESLLLSYNQFGFVCDRLLYRSVQSRSSIVPAMADPVTFLGTAGAVANIIGIIGATISTIRELYQHWDDADFTYLNLVVQLTALQAAVTKIQEWSDRDLDDQHFQLKMNLELSLTGCKVLATKLHDFIAKCQTQPDELPATSGKIRLVLGSSQVEEVQKSIERLTSALNLLLNACNWYGIAHPTNDIACY